MKYQVRDRTGRLVFWAQGENLRYNPRMEYEIQQAGYTITIDGKRLKKTKPEELKRKPRKEKDRNE